MGDEHDDRPGTAVPATKTRLLGSLRDALAAASREEKAIPLSAGPPALPVLAATSKTRDMNEERDDGRPSTPAQGPSAKEAAREARGTYYERREDSHVEMDAPTTRVVRGAPVKASGSDAAEGRTRVLRGKQSVRRTEFHQDPVVGWLVIVGGPGLGAYRPIHEGNNSIGRSDSQRIPINFGDDAISSEEQAFIRYDSVDRKFLLVPNLAKTNIVAVNDRKPTAAVELAAMDLLTMGRTQLCFVPFCGPEFDWSELTELKD
jgi:hypothetical protein